MDGEKGVSRPSTICRTYGVNKVAKAQSKNGNQIMTENEIGKIVVDAAIAVHRTLGPGLLE